jgi:hypothetical protein
MSGVDLNQKVKDIMEKYKDKIAEVKQSQDSQGIKNKVDAVLQRYEPQIKYFFETNKSGIARPAAIAPPIAPLARPVAPLPRPVAPRAAPSAPSAPSARPPIAPLARRVASTITAPPIAPLIALTRKNPHLSFAPSNDIIAKLTPADNAVLDGNNIDAIETWVEAKRLEFKIPLIEENIATKVLEKLDEETIGDFFKDTFNGFERMVSSSYKNDCLIHSLLNALSPTFRKINLNNNEDTDKNKIASYFRRTILPIIYNNQITGSNNTKATKLRIQSELKKNGALDIDVAGVFSEKYNVNIFLKDRDNTINPGKNAIWYLLTPKAIVKKNATNKERTTAGLLAQTSAPVILLYNPGKNHFEAIRDPTNNTYIFEYNLIQDWYAIEEAKVQAGGKRFTRRRPKA